MSDHDRVPFERNMVLNNLLSLSFNAYSNMYL